MAQLDVSHRQRTEHMKAVASLTRGGHFKDAFEVLGERVVSSGVDFREAAARKWLELSAEDRERPRSMLRGAGRAHLNALVQDGLKAEGVCAVKALRFRVWKASISPARKCAMLTITGAARFWR
jgi:hypothetical protein